MIREMKEQYDHDEPNEEPKQISR
jgi:hypothetical protein